MEIFAVAKSGKRVDTSTDPNDFIFHSSYNTFKILAEAVLTAQTIDSNPKTITVAHNQAQAPTFYAFAKFPDGKVAMPSSNAFFTQGGTSVGSFNIEVDATNLYFIFTRPGSNYNVDIKYYIFETPI